MNLNNLTAEQIGKLFPIRIVPYNPEWKMLFEKEKALIEMVLGTDIALNIEHIGSTSIAGLAAKPTIDILVETPRLSDELKQIITSKLEAIGYGNMHNSNEGNKMSFGKGYDENYDYAQTYHVHLFEKGSVPQDETYFRDYLRRHPDIRDEYARLKYALAEKYQFNREDYTQAKTEFINRITWLQKEKEITLQPLLAEDIPLFSNWLNKEYIYKRLCPDGEEQRKAWLDEVNNKDGKYGFLKHFIVCYGGKKIGYCLHADCFFLKGLEEKGHDFEDFYGDIAEENHTYEIGYFIGEEEYLNKGISNIIIRLLEEKIIALGGREIAADPSEENTFSVKALLSNGFKKKRNGDYRKIIASQS